MTKRYLDYAIVRSMKICCDTCQNCLRNTEDMFLCKVDSEKCLAENYLLWTFPVNLVVKSDKQNHRLRFLGIREEEE